jgi:hypothetical protein
MSDDSFIREVDEELRQDQLKSIWNRFGNILIGVAVLIVLATAAWRGWQYWQEQRAASSGDAFLSAIEASERGNQDDSIAQLQKLAESGTGEYPVIARLRLAGEHEARGETDKAIGLYEAIANNGSISEPLRSIARLRAGMVAVDRETYEQVKARLEPLAAAGNPYRHLAREALGLSAYKAGALEEAHRWFNAIANDAGATTAVRNRVNVMLELLAGKGLKSAG